MLASLLSFFCRKPHNHDFTIYQPRAPSNAIFFQTTILSIQTTTFFPTNKENKDKAPIFQRFPTTISFSQAIALLILLINLRITSRSVLFRAFVFWAYQVPLQDLPSSLLILPPFFGKQRYWSITDYKKQVLLILLRFLGARLYSGQGHL